MKTSADYIEDLKTRHDLPSDGAAARMLGVTRQAVSNIKNRKDSFSDRTARKVAELLEIDPLEVVLSAHAERASDNDDRELWTRALTRLRGRSGEPFCIMSTSRRRLPAPDIGPLIRARNAEKAGHFRPFQ